VQRFREPLHVFKGSRSGIVRLRTTGGMSLPQEVDIGPSAETTRGAKFIHMSAHEKNRCILFINRSLEWAWLALAAD
jgi:hypothetical protein